MKLITAVIGKKDLNPVCDALREAGYSFTKIPTSGGFLRNSNMTLLIGVEDDKLAHAVELINQNCKSRTEQNEEVQMTGDLAYMTACPCDPLRVGIIVNHIMGGVFGAVGAREALSLRDHPVYGPG